MIALTRLNHVPLVLNSDLIEYVEVTPDTVITLTTGQKIVVLESAEEVVGRVVAFRRSLISESPHSQSSHSPDADEMSVEHIEAGSGTHGR